MPYPNPEAFNEPPAYDSVIAPAQVQAQAQAQGGEKGGAKGLLGFVMR